MKIGIPKESYPDEQRVALIPQVIAKLAAAGFTILIQKGAGKLAGFSDEDYQAKGAVIVLERQTLFNESDFIFFVHALNQKGRISREDLDMMHRSQILISLLNPLASPDVAKTLAEKGIDAFALELIPRIARAQSMDVLSSMATIAGYKAVLLAADHLSRLFPLMMTAAGTLLPARVLIIGAGVAGLQAIATARRLGAVVQAWDVRQAAREQVESLGAHFLEFPMEPQDAEVAGGYARTMDDAFYRRQHEFMTAAILESHVVVASAAVFGSRAPILITADMVERMLPGAVIVDLVGEQGGNCELTESCKIVIRHDVTIISPANLASTVSYHASQMFANNLANFILHLTNQGKTPPPDFNRDDQIIHETMITRGGEVVHPALKKILDSGSSAVSATSGGTP